VSTFGGEPNVYDTIADYLPPSERYSVLSIDQSSLGADEADLTDSMEVSFLIVGRPGTFTIETPLVYENVPDPQAQAFLIDELVLQEADVVDALYAL